MKWIFGVLLVATVSCGEPPANDEEIRQSTNEISSSDRTRRYARMRNAAMMRGIGTGYLLAGISYTESGLAHCWSEATWACKGPSSPDCGGGPVIAGAWDGPCGAQQGGLGMFQFDAGTFGDTLRAYGNEVLTIDGQVRSAIDFVVDMVRRSIYVPNTDTLAKARAWVASFDPNDAVRRDQWIKTVLRHYNGCEPGWSCWAPRYQSYSEGLSTVLAETGGTAFWRTGTTCAGARGVTVGAIDARYRALGGCGSILGEPITVELGAPDGRGRYVVFEKGSIYWTAQTGAHEVHGRIRDEYAARGWEAGVLGYPTSGEVDVPGGKKSEFEHGSIAWNATTDDFVVEVIP